MLLNAFDDYMLYWTIAHLFHVSLVTAYWAANIAIVVVLIVFILILIFKH